MTDLIERLEKATGPSREIDGLIFKLIGDRPGDFWHEFEVGENGDGVWYRQCRDDAVAYECPPTFTDSIDAALTLVPPGRYADVCGIGHSPTATIWNKAFEAPQNLYQVPGATPALALCIAALKARMASFPSTGSTTP